MLFGMNALLRPVATGLILLPAFVVFVSRRRVEKAGKAITILLGSSFVTVLPWMAINYQEDGFFGISRGVGLNLCVRVFDHDHLPMLRFGGVKFEARLPRYGHNHLASFLSLRSHLLKNSVSQVEIDAYMYEIAEAAIRRHPAEYLAGTLELLADYFADDLAEQKVCDSENGKYVCMLERTREDDPPFSAQPPLRRPVLNELVATVFGFDIINRRALLIAALVGLGIFFRTSADSTITLGTMLILTVVYFGLTTCLLNVPKVRYRLPADPFLLMFACYAVIYAVKLTHARLWPDKQITNAPRVEE